MKLQPGQRDEKGRLFLGWRVKYETGKRSCLVASRDARSDLEFSLDDLVKMFHGTIVRVFRRPSKVRRALIELLESVDAMRTIQAPADKWLDPVVLIRARKALKR